MQSRGREEWEKGAGKAKTPSDKKPPKRGNVREGRGKKRRGHYEDKRKLARIQREAGEKGRDAHLTGLHGILEKRVERMNEGKVGAPYHYPESLIIFLGFLHNLISYRELEGFKWKLKKNTYPKSPSSQTTHKSGEG
ncbi:MAG: hypothetical protein QXS27_00410 [Candidatus Jordarchaeaceae archaeon]